MMWWMEDDTKTNLIFIKQHPGPSCQSIATFNYSGQFLVI